MSTTRGQDDKFLEFLREKFPRDLFEDVVKHVAEEMEPSEVFSRDELVAWAENEGLETVFSESRLKEWALNAGYVWEE